MSPEAPAGSSDTVPEGGGDSTSCVSRFKDSGKGGETHSRSESTVFVSCRCCDKSAHTG